MSKTPDTKSDLVTGEKVHEYLVHLGLETPMTSGGAAHMAASPLEPQAAIQEHVASIMGIMGLDLTDDSLMDTPKRVAKMFLNELFWGLDYSNFPKATVVENKMNYDEMILERRVTVHSTCEHHLLPILGHAHVAYIPKDKVLGLSKLNRIVEFFARRPQIQERLTAQICATLQLLLGTKDVAVCIDAEHLCVKTRGVEDACSDTVTSKLGGVFKSKDATRAEFFNMINVNRS
jgi:GTP cyclohydrolase I